jgi:hypothetical protein
VTARYAHRDFGNAGVPDEQTAAYSEDESHN